MYVIEWYLQASLPEVSFRKRDKSGLNLEDRKSKTESLDIQTLARLQEQSLRDSFSAVRKGTSVAEATA